MKCPVCTDSTLIMSERQGVEIDHCPQCRGVWLDRGELDKIIDRSARFDDDDDDDDRRRQAAPPVPPATPQGYPPPPPPPQYGDPRGGYQPDYRGDYRRGDDDYHKHKYHKRKSFWSELFD